MTLAQTQSFSTWDGDVAVWVWPCSELFCLDGQSHCTSVSVGGANERVRYWRRQRWDWTGKGVEIPELFQWDLGRCCCGEHLRCKSNLSSMDYIRGLSVALHLQQKFVCRFGALEVVWSTVIRCRWPTYHVCADISRLSRLGDEHFTV